MENELKFMKRVLILLSLVAFGLVSCKTTEKPSYEEQTAITSTGPRFRSARKEFHSSVTVFKKASFLQSTLRSIASKSARKKVKS